MFPDKLLPNLENLERQRTALIAQRKQMNEDYKKIADELKEIEYARTSIRQYLQTTEQSRKKEELE